MLTPEERRAKIGAVIRVASGNFLEMYDFIVYGCYAVYIGNAFFPSHSEFASLMLSPEHRQQSGACDLALVRRSDWSRWNPDVKADAGNQPRGTKYPPENIASLARNELVAANLRDFCGPASRVRGTSDPGSHCINSGLALCHSVACS
jgi:hypothetical protein